MECMHGTVIQTEEEESPALDGCDAPKMPRASEG
jgi:hypothetical protein